MKTSADAGKMPTAELLQLFEEYSLAESAALRRLDTKTHNAIFKKMQRIEAELKARQKRSELAALYQHADPHVRYNAAVETLNVFPEEAREVLQRISDRDEWPSAMYARGILRGLAEGSFVPN